MHQQKLITPTFTIKSSSLVVLTLATAYFSRVISAVGVPAVVNFLHFAFAGALFGLILPQIQSPISKNIFGGLLVLLGLIAFSALVNDAGAINIVLDFLLLAEPFMLLLAITSTRMTVVSVKRFGLWILLFAAVNLIFAYCQSLIMGLGANPDHIKGVFLNQGAGHHVGGAVALTAAVYFLVGSDIRSTLIRALIALAFTVQTYPLSDSKQVIAVFLVSLVILSFTKMKNFGEALRYLVLTGVVVGIVTWAALNIFSIYWLKNGLVGAGLEQKFSVFSLIASYFDSPLNWMFGLGPGHTIGRLGLLIPDYLEVLQPLGATVSPVTGAILQANEGNWMSAKSGSSMFALTFSWAGVWGDLGFIGLGVYLYLWFLVWRYLCVENLSKFFLISILIFGCIFSWMEEPGYMLFVVSLIGYQWQVHQAKAKHHLTKGSRKMHPSEAV